MVRECLLAAVIAACLPGCSLILDFSDSAGVHDASIDGPYTPEECAYKEPNDTPATAMIVTAADTGPGAICKPDGDAGISEDDDYYKFTVAAGITKVTLTLVDGPMAGDLDLLLFDASGTTKLAQSRGFTDTETLICPGISPACPTLAEGDYVFEVIPGAPGNLNNYTFSIAFE
jgi:hypothetical protein